MRRYFILLSCLALLCTPIFYTSVYADDSMTIKVGIYENEPKIFTDDQGNASGFWPDVIEYIASEEGWEIEYVHGTWAECLDMLESGEIDVMPDVAYSQERSTLYDFSTEFVYSSWSRVYAREGISIQSILDLEGRSVAVMEGSVNVEGPEGIKILASSFGVSCSFIEVDSYTGVFELMDSGEADAGVTSKDFGSQHEADYGVIKTGIIFQPSLLYFAFPKDSDLSPYLIERIDYHIGELKADEGSIYYQLLEQWFGVEPVEKIVVPEWLIWALIGVGGLAVVLAGGVYTLRFHVRSRTKELIEEIGQRRRAEEKYSTLVEQSNDGVIVIQEALLKFANNKMLAMSGFSPEEFVGKSFLDFVAPEFKDVVAENYRKRMSGEEAPERYEIEIQAKDGRHIPVEVNASRIEYEGSPADMAIIRDITERKRAEEDLRTSEEKLRLMFESIGDGITLADLNGEIIQTNEATVRMNGYESKEEIIGRQASELVALSDRHRLDKDIEEVFKGGTIKSREYMFLAKGGREYPGELTVTPFRDNSGNLIGTITIAKDITERRQAESALRQSEERYRDLFDNANDMIQSVLSDGRLLYVNKAWRNALGYSEEEIADMKIWDVIHSDSMDHCMEVFQKVISGQDASGIDAVFIAKDGKEVDVEGNAHCRFINGTPVSTQGIFRNVTDRKKAEERIEHLSHVLRALRDINQLITREMDRERLIKESCDVLVKDRGYEKAWILLVDENRNPLAFAGAGLEEKSPSFLEQMTSGNYPGCVKDLWAQKSSFLAYDCPGLQHKDCILADVHSDAGVYRYRLEYDGKVYGVLGITLPSSAVDDKEEQGLFLELAGDISYALAAIERQEERRRVEEELQHSEAMLEEAQHIAHIGSWELDLISNKLTWSDEVYRIFGLKPKQFEATYEAFLDNIHPDDREMVNKAYTESVETKTPYNIVHRLLLKDGTVKYVNERCGTFYNKEGRPIRSAGTVQDITEYKKAEEALRESQERLSMAVEATKLGFWDWKVQTGEAVFNERWAEIVGYTLEELSPVSIDTWIKLAHPDDLKKSNELLEKHFRGETDVYEFESRMKHKSGQWVWVLDTGRVVEWDDRGKPVRAIGTHLDITERKRSEEALRDSEEKLRQMFESAADSITVTDFEGNIIQANEATARMHKYGSKEELVGLSSLALIAKKDHDRAIEGMKRTLAEGSTGDVEYTFVTKDGREFPAELSAAVLKDGRGNPLGFIAVTKDITERKKAEEDLRTSEEKLRRMFEAITDGITIVNMDGKIIQANEAAAHLHGYDTREEFIGKKIFDFLSPADHAGAKEYVRNVTGGGIGTENIEINLVRKDGVEFPAEMSSSVIKNIKGKPVGLVSVFRDITDRRKMEEHLIVTDRLASIGELASGIAHELNNPLTGVIGLSQLLVERDTPDDIKEDLKLVYSEAQRAAAVVKNMLTFARKHPAEKQPVSLNDVINKTMELRAYEQKTNNIEAITNLAPGLPRIMADAFQLQQVFLNIIINAEHFMIEEHGRGTLTITTVRDDGIIRVSFADDGPGIPEEDIGHIFDPFFTTKEVGKGTGLGLSICYGIINSHNGRIYAESKPGEGATFIVELPIEQGKQ